MVKKLLLGLLITANLYAVNYEEIANKIKIIDSYEIEVTNMTKDRIYKIPIGSLKIYSLENYQDNYKLETDKREEETYELRNSSSFKESYLLTTREGQLLEYLLEKKQDLVKEAIKGDLR